MADGYFTPKTKALVAARAGYMCSNPDCNRLLVGPEVNTNDSLLKSSIGEFAHIRGRADDSPRWEPAMTDDQRADPENAIFLCATCHTLIDNNGGPGYTAGDLTAWRDAHTATVRRLLASPIALLSEFRRREKNGAIVSHIFNVIADKRAVYERPELESWSEVISSLGTLRTTLTQELKEVENDYNLAKLIKNIIASARTFMTKVKIDPYFRPALGQEHAERHLAVMREEIGETLRLLATAYNIPLPDPLMRPNWILGGGLR
ncbi:HNH endonuclease [Nocardia sp. MW-W600-9]